MGEVVKMMSLVEQKLKKINELKEKLNEYAKKEDEMREVIKNFLEERLSFLKDLEDLGVENFEVEYNGYIFDLRSLRFTREGHRGYIFDDNKVLAYFLGHFECILNQFLDNTIVWLSENLCACIDAYKEMEKVYEVYKQKYKK